VVLQGFGDPVRAVEVIPDVPLPRVPSSPWPDEGGRRRTRLAVAIVATLFVLGAVAVALSEWIGGGGNGTAASTPPVKPRLTLEAGPKGTGGTIVLRGAANTGPGYRSIADIRLYPAAGGKSKGLWLATVSADGRYELVIRPLLDPGSYTAQTSQSYGGGIGVSRTAFVPFSVPTPPAGATDSHGTLTISSPPPGATMSAPGFRVAGTDDPNPVAGLGYVQVFAAPGNDLRQRHVWTSPPARVAADGTWSTAFDSTLPPGPYTLFVKETDAKGFVTGLSRTLRLTWNG